MKKLIILYPLMLIYCLAITQQTDCESSLEKAKTIYSDNTLSDSIKNIQFVNFLEGFPLNGCDTVRATAFVMHANIYKDLGNYENAKKQYDKSLTQRTNLKLYGGVVSIYNNLVDWANQQEQYGQALIYAGSALQINQEYQLESDLLPKIYINRAAAYKGIKEYEESEIDYNKAIDLLKRNGDEYTLAIANQGLGDLLLTKKDYPTALNYYEQARAIYLVYDELNDVAQIDNSIGSAYYRQGELELAQQKYEVSLAGAKEQNNKMLQQDALTNLVIVHSKKGETGKTEQYEKQLTESIQEEIGSTSDKRYVLLALNQKYKAKEEYEKALQVFEYIYNLNDTIRTQEEKEKIAEIRANLASEKKNKQLFKLLMLGILLITLLSYAVYWQRKKSKEKEKALEEFKKQQTIKYFKKGRDRIKRDITDLAHEIHDEKTRITIIKRELEFILNNPKNEKTQKSLDNAIDILNNIFSNLRRISQSLRNSFDWSRQMLMEIEQLERDASIKVESKNFNIDEQIPEEVGEELSKIFSVLLDNVREHAVANTISIDLTKTEDELILMVEDDGVGFEPMEEVFNVGLKSVKQRVEQTLKGKLDIDAEKGRGSIFIITVPIS